MGCRPGALKSFEVDAIAFGEANGETKCALMDPGDPGDFLFDGSGAVLPHPSMEQVFSPGPEGRGVFVGCAREPGAD